MHLSNGRFAWDTVILVVSLNVRGWATCFLPHDISGIDIGPSDDGDSLPVKFGISPIEAESRLKHRLIRTLRCQSNTDEKHEIETNICSNSKLEGFIKSDVRSIHLSDGDRAIARNNLRPIAASPVEDGVLGSRIMLSTTMIGLYSSRNVINKAGLTAKRSASGGAFYRNDVLLLNNEATGKLPRNGILHLMPPLPNSKRRSWKSFVEILRGIYYTEARFCFSVNALRYSLNSKFATNIEGPPRLTASCFFVVVESSLLVHYTSIRSGSLCDEHILVTLMIMMSNIKVV
nr:hypothetical protein CFP56_07616 [Quercus suber]